MIYVEAYCRSRLCDLLTYLLIYFHFWHCWCRPWFIRFVYVQDQETYSLYLFSYHIVKFRSTTIPLFQQIYRDLFLIDWLLFKINSAVSHKEQTRLYFYSPGVPKMRWVSVIRNVTYSLTYVYVYVTQWFNHLCFIPCFLVFSKVVAIFSKTCPSCLTWFC